MGGRDNQALPVEGPGSREEPGQRKEFPPMLSICQEEFINFFCFGFVFYLISNNFTLISLI